MGDQIRSTSSIFKTHIKFNINRDLGSEFFLLQNIILYIQIKLKRLKRHTRGLMHTLSTNLYQSIKCKLQVKPYTNDQIILLLNINHFFSDQKKGKTIYREKLVTHQQSKAGKMIHKQTIRNHTRPKLNRKDSSKENKHWIVKGLTQIFSRSKMQEGKLNTTEGFSKTRIEDIDKFWIKLLRSVIFL